MTATAVCPKSFTFERGLRGWDADASDLDGALASLPDTMWASWLSRDLHEDIDKTYGPALDLKKLYRHSGTRWPAESEATLTWSRSKLTFTVYNQSFTRVMTMMPLSSAEQDLVRQWRERDGWYRYAAALVKTFGVAEFKAAMDTFDRQIALESPADDDWVPSFSRRGDQLVKLLLR
jgi:hypothetical protein